MSSICLIDTSIFVEILDVPKYNQHRASVLKDYETYVKSDCTFLLPMATILETGNHIAQNGDGTMRRITAYALLKKSKLHSTEMPPGSLLHFQTQQRYCCGLISFRIWQAKTKLLVSKKEQVSVISASFKNL